MAELAQRTIWGGGRSAAVWFAVAVAVSAAAGVGLQVEPMLVLDLAIAAAAAAAIAVRPFEALLLILVLRGTLVNSQFADVATFAGGALALAAAAPRLPVKRLSVPLILFLLVALPGVPLRPSLDEGYVPPGYVPLLGEQYIDPPSTELLQWLRLGAALAVLCLAGWSVRSRFRLETVVGAILVGAVYPIFKGIEQIVTGDFQARAGFDAIRGPFYQSNYYAFFLVVVLVIAVAALIELHGPWWRLGAGAVLVFGSVCLVFTYTRAAWVGFALALLVLGLLLYRRMLVLISIAMACAAFGFPTQTNRVENRIANITNPGSSGDDSWSWRRGEWERMFPHGRENLLTGTGFGSYSRVTVEEFGTQDPQYATDITPGRLGFAAHNDYLKSFVENGLPGFVLWALVLTGAVSVMWRARREPRVRGFATAGVALSVALIPMSFSDNIQAYTAVLIYAFGFIGAVAGAATAMRRARPPRAAATGSRAAPGPA